MDNAMEVATINDYPVAKYNRLFPATLTQISPLHKVMVNIVTIDSNPSNGEVYEQTRGKGEEKIVVGLSLTKIACLKLMTAANVIMEESKPLLPQGCQRCIEIAKNTRLAPQCNGCSTKQDVAYQVSILVPEPSGGHRRYVATKEISKQDTLAKKNPLEHMAANCETKALLRALRAGLGIKGTYTKSELAKPFAVALVVLNTTDPELKAALIQRYAAGQDALFGNTPSSPQLSSPEFLELPSGGIAGEVIVMEDDHDYEPQNTNLNTDDTPPWELNANTPTCEGCARILEANGSWTVEMIIDYSKRKFGKVLCPTCQKGGN